MIRIDPKEQKVIEYTRFGRMRKVPTAFITTSQISGKARRQNFQTFLISQLVLYLKFKLSGNRCLNLE